MKNSMLLILSLCLLAGAAHADIAFDGRSFAGSAILGPEDGPALQAYYFNNDRTLSADTLYTLRGQVYFEEGAALRIPAGTLILGEPAGTIVIKQGGQIFSEGTAEAPVVFTSNRAPGSRDSGDWGGVVILGRAPINRDPESTNIEGGIIEGTYGGDNEFDNSGVFVYTRIEFAGYRFEEGNEINGLTMGGVGAGTELHHVQVSYANDDSYEWFGGTVDAHHLIAFGGLDDDFDVDDGYTGRLQFLFGLKDPAKFDAAGSSNGFENDSRNEAEPFSLPIYSNVTLVGPERTNALVGNLPEGNTHADILVFRENTRSSVFNSVLMGFVDGLSIRDLSIDAANAGDLRIKNTSISTMGEHDFGRWADVQTWFETAGWNNLGGDPRMPSAAGLTNMDDLNDPQPQPLIFSELDGTADFSDPYLADVAGRYSFDTTANYRGAFVPDVAMDQQWTAGWSNFDPNGTEYIQVAVEDTGLPAAGIASMSSYPNPFNPATTLKFSVPRAGHVSLKVYNVAGRMVADVHQGSLAAGQFTVDFVGTDLASGTYFARLQGDGFSAVHKMQLVK